ncbi:hypothetical protein OHB26_02785 [Nocardia sp. NBC_01503]|uniref:hypothetical protein n=1 Tax=Nocardia sp. NBC_01503 TaxID=2975997 RepID=UPI002E7C1062|nr:hypothetical protein [Nocardia sp. NBC_01503]WTL33199.1 hypothetical protein OHB26_02785 [Nocardia sp. NBC_01503]
MRISLHGTGDGIRVRVRLEVNRRRWLALQIMLAILALQGLIVGAWAVFAPHSWYTSFPGFGMRWVGMDGPYNHHLASDVGAFFLAMAAVTGVALWFMDSLLARAAGAGWLVFGIPHLLYHTFHRPEAMSTVSFTLSVIAAFALPALGVACVLVAPRERRPIPEPAPFTLRFPRRGRSGSRPPR